MNRTYAPIFEAERAAIAPLVQNNRTLLAGLAACALLGTFAPIVLPQMHKHFKTALLATGLLSSAAASALTYKTPTEEKIAKTIEEQQLEEMRDRFAHQITMGNMAREMTAQLQAISTIETLPEHVKNYYLQYYGFAAMAQPQALPQQQGMQQPLQPGQLHDLSIDDWEAEQQEAAGLSAPALYSKAIKEHMIFCGNQGEGKTVAAQYALAQWAGSDPDLVPFVFDPHYGSGRNPQYEAHWLGIPQIKELPKNVSTGVFKGEAKHLLPWLRIVQRLFRYRRANDVRSPRVVAVVEELTNLIPFVEEEEAKEISKILAELGTEAPKFGMNFWFICHTLTKDEIMIERKVLRQAHVVMGVEMSQDRVQVSNSPRSLSASSIEQAQLIYQQHGKPAGFVTSLPVPDGYLPKPPVSDTRDLIRDWVQASSTLDSGKTPEPTEQVSPYKAMWMWIQELGRMPSNEEAQAAWQNLTQETLNTEAIAHLIKNIERLAGV